MLFAGDYAPSSWMFCRGQQLAIEEYPELFSIIGITYGWCGTNFGDKQIYTHFALPNLMCIIPVGTSRQGTILSPIELGEHNFIPTHGSSQKGTLGLNYCICVEGIYPQRD